MTEFEVLTERPASGRGKTSDLLKDAILRTATDGGAVRVHLNGNDTYTRLVNRYTVWFRTKQLRGRFRKQEDGSLIVWAEKK